MFKNFEIFFHTFIQLWGISSKEIIKFWKRCKRYSYWCIFFIGTHTQKKENNIFNNRRTFRQFWYIHEIVSGILKCYKEFLMTWGNVYTIMLSETKEVTKQHVTSSMLRGLLLQAGGLVLIPCPGWVCGAAKF